MIAIVDYGLGNVKAFLNIFKMLTIPAVLARKASDLEHATKIILPGVGAFDFAISQLKLSGMMDPLNELVLHKKIPILGVCVGMQMMARVSEEGKLPGLGWIDAKVCRLNDRSSLTGNPLLLPHMGWNQIQVKSDQGLFKGLQQEAKFYFLHSYHVVMAQEQNEIAIADYGQKICAAIAQDHIFGMQCHPEKSHGFGIQFLRNFAEF